MDTASQQSIDEILTQSTNIEKDIEDIKDMLLKMGYKELSDKELRDKEIRDKELRDKEILFFNKKEGIFSSHTIVIDPKKYAGKSNKTNTEPVSSSQTNSYFDTLFNNYANFEGKAKRSEFWTFLIVNVIIKIILGVVSVKMNLYTSDAPGSMTLLDGGFAIAMFIPTIAVSVRRIHDIGLSGWWGWIFMPLALPMIIVGFIRSKYDK